MPKVKIVKVPKWPEVPPLVAAGWFGLKVDVGRPAKRELTYWGKPESFAGIGWVYEVNAENRKIAMQNLERADFDSWLWFSGHSKNGCRLYFPVEYCADIELYEEFTGRLTVSIRALGDISVNCKEPTSLFGYIQKAYSCFLSTAKTTPSDWSIWQFNPEQKIIKVAKFPLD
jgi:hypothetical protein